MKKAIIVLLLLSLLFNTGFTVGINIADIYASAHFKDEGLLNGLKKTEDALEDVAQKSGDFEKDMNAMSNSSMSLGDKMKKLGYTFSTTSSGAIKIGDAVEELVDTTDATGKKFIDFSVMGQRMGYQLRQFGINIRALPVPLLAAGVATYALGKAVAKSVEYTAGWSQKIKGLDQDLLGAGMRMNAFQMAAADTFNAGKNDAGGFGDAFKLRIGNYVIPIINNMKSGFENLTSPLTKMWDMQNKIIDSTLKVASTYDEFLDTAIDQTPYYQTMVRAWGLEKARIAVSQEYTREMYNQLKAQQALGESQLAFNAIMTQPKTPAGPNIPGVVGGMGGFGLLGRGSEVVQETGQNYQIFDKYGISLSNVVNNLEIMKSLNPIVAQQMSQEFAPALAAANVELGIMTETQAVNQLGKDMSISTQEAQKLYDKIIEGGGAFKALDGLSSRSTWYIDVIYNYHGGGGIPSGKGSKNIWGKGVPENLFARGANFVVPPGYEHDTFPIFVESGEIVQVIPKSKVNTAMRNWAMPVNQLPQNNPVRMGVPIDVPDFTPNSGSGFTAAMGARYRKTIEYATLFGPSETKHIDPLTTPGGKAYHDANMSSIASMLRDRREQMAMESTSSSVRQSVNLAVSTSSTATNQTNQQMRTLMAVNQQRDTKNAMVSGDMLAELRAMRKLLEKLPTNVRDAVLLTGRA